MSFASVVLTIFIWYLIKIQFMLPQRIDDDSNDNDDQSVIREEQQQQQQQI